MKSTPIVWSPLPHPFLPLIPALVILHEIFKKKKKNLKPWPSPSSLHSTYCRWRLRASWHQTDGSHSAVSHPKVREKRGMCLQVNCQPTVTASSPDLFFEIATCWTPAQDTPSPHSVRLISRMSSPTANEPATTITYYESLPSHTSRPLQRRSN